MNDQEILKIATRAIISESQAVASLAEQLNPAFVQAAQAILNCKGHIIVSGSGTSHAVALRCAHLLSCCGVPAFFLHPGDSQHGSAGAVRADDLLVVISKGGETFEVNFLVKAAKERGANVIGITEMPASSLGRTSDITLVIRAPEDVDPFGMIAIGSSLFNSAFCDAIYHRVALVTEDRKSTGLFLQTSLKTNITISGLREISWLGFFIRQKDELAKVLKLIKMLFIKTTDPEFPVANMSGGNQQKVILARWLNIGAKVLLLDEPTRGIDVGSKSEIYQIMAQLAEQGVGLIMVSSELPEILGMCDRILVMHDGKMVKELSRAEASEEVIMSYAA